MIRSKSVTLSELVAEFAAKGRGLTEKQLSEKTTPLGDLWIAPNVFQPRDEDNPRVRSHIDSLARSIKHGAKMPPLRVFAVGGHRYVVDGHCRLHAYFKAGKTVKDAVRIEHERGELRDALLAVAESNSADKLAYRQSEKNNAAWRIVCASWRGPNSWSVSKAATALAADVSERQVALMRDAFQNLTGADECTTWTSVLALQHGSELSSEDDAEAKLQERATELACAIWRAVPRRARRNDALVQMTLERAFPKALESLRAEWEAQADEYYVCQACAGHGSGINDDF